MAELLNVEVRCEICDSVLLVHAKTNDQSYKYMDTFTIKVEPCESCLKDARDEVRKELKEE